MLLPAATQPLPSITHEYLQAIEELVLSCCVTARDVDCKLFWAEFAFLAFGVVQTRHVLLQDQAPGCYKSKMNTICHLRTKGVFCRL